MAYTDMPVKEDHISRVAKDIGTVVTYTAEKPVEEYDSNKVFQNIGGAVTYTVAKPVEDHNSSKVLKDRNESELIKPNLQNK